MEFLARRKLTFLALIMGALLLYPFAPKSALAQEMIMPEVASNGVGDLLIFPYWSTMNRDTIIELTNTTSHTPVFTRVRFLDMAGEVLEEFTIGLCERDVWTAVLTAGMMNGDDMTTMLQVVSPGKVDGKVDEANYEEPPMEDDDGMIPMLELDGYAGYIEVFSMPDQRDVDDDADTEANEEVDGRTVHLNRDVITGAAFILNTGVGSGESVPATVLVGFNAGVKEDPDTAGTFIVDASPEDRTAVGNMMVADALAREGGVDKEILLTHFNINADFAGSTMMVITFPTDNRAMDDREDDEKPVSISAIDPQGELDFSPVSMELDMNVNMIDVSTLGEDSPRNLLRQGYITEGWIRILENGEGKVDAFPKSRFPAIGQVFQSVENGAMSFNQSYPWQWAAMIGAGGYAGIEADQTGADNPVVINTRETGTSLKPSLTMFRPWYQRVGADEGPQMLTNEVDGRTRMNMNALPNFFMEE